MKKISQCTSSVTTIKILKMLTRTFQIKTNKLCLFVSLCIGMFPLNISSQIACGNTGQISQQSNLFCGSNNIIDYIPQSTDKVKTIDIVVNVMQREYPNDPYNFSDTPEHIAAIKSFLFNHPTVDVNKHPLRGLQVNAYDGDEYPNDPYIQDGKIDVRILDINFIQDNDGWNNNNSISGSYNYDLYKEKGDVALMVYLVEGITVGDPPALWSVGGAGPSNYIILHGYYKSYKLNGENANPWTTHWMDLRELAAHELGHSVGSLNHTFQGCDFDDIIPCPTYAAGCYPYGEDASTPNCSNNIMSYATVRRYLSPKQLASFHRNFARTNFSRFVNHVKDSPASDLTISSSQTWTVDRFVYGDIHIQAGASLTINCSVFMPPTSRIIVKQGARLIVDCGKISTNRMPINSSQQFSHGDYWYGIEVWGNTTVPQTLAMRNPAYVQQLTDPGIVLISNSEINNAYPAISTIQRGPYSWEVKKTNFGGLVYAKHSIFSNNRRTAEFLKYDFTNLSAFIDCDFINTPVGTDAVTIWETDGIEFKFCRFSGSTRVGILAFDAKIKVTGSDFINARHGIENKSSYEMSSGLLVGPTETNETLNEFENCFVGVFLTATTSADIVSNDFLSNDRGIYAEGSCEYNVTKNDFLSCRVGMQNAQTLSFGNNIARCNLFQQNDRGLMYQGDNSGATFFYNEFTFDAGSSYNVQLTNATDVFNFYSGKIRESQKNQNGPIGNPAAGNLFGTNPTPFLRHIVAPENLTTLFTYHVTDRTLQPRVYPVCGKMAELCIPGTPEDQNFNYFSYPNLAHNTTWCSTIPIAGAAPCVAVPCYNDIKTIYDQAVLAYQNNPTQANLENMVIARTNKYSTLRKVLAELQKIKDYATYLNVVNGETNDFGKRAKLWYFIDRNDWLGASQYLSSFQINNSNDQAFVTIQNINITRLQAGYDYVLPTSSVNTLRALSTTFLPDRVYARTLLVQMRDTLFEPEEIEDLDERSSADYEVSTDSRIKIWPNPTNNLLNIDLGTLWQENKLHTISIVNVSGKELFNSTLNSFETEVNISSIPSGFYFIQFKLNNEIIAVEKLIKLL